VKYYQRERLTGHGVDNKGKVIGPSTPLRDISETNYREWGDPNKISKLYMKPERLKRLSKQLGLPYHLVCRKFDKKAAELMGTSVSSPSFGGRSGDRRNENEQLVVSGVLEDSFGSSSSGDHEIPFHHASNKRSTSGLKAKPPNLTVSTREKKG
jgi:hypothetical protein